MDENGAYEKGGVLTFSMDKMNMRSVELNQTEMRQVILSLSNQSMTQASSALFFTLYDLPRPPTSNS